MLAGSEVCQVAGGQEMVGGVRRAHYARGMGSPIPRLLIAARGEGRWAILSLPLSFQEGEPKPLMTASRPFPLWCP